MNLLKCPDCEKEISSQARRCVFCGYQSNGSVLYADLGFDGVIFRLIIAVGIIAAIAGYHEGLWIAGFGVLFLLLRSLR